MIVLQLHYRKPQDLLVYDPSLEENLVSGHNGSRKKKKASFFIFLSLSRPTSFPSYRSPLYLLGFWEP
ncbi:hypothetical protein LguiA_003079 [Lonicera macranthoides]